MITTRRTSSVVNPRHQELRKLQFLASEAEIQEALGKIAGAFGKVNSIAYLAQGSDPSAYVFFVDFEDTLDAMTAARDLNGFLYGFSALMVKVQKSGNVPPEKRYARPPLNSSARRVPDPTYARSH